jgi:hypothetical protein
LVKILVALATRQTNQKQKILTLYYSVKVAVRNFKSLKEVYQAKVKFFIKEDQNA